MVKDLCVSVRSFSETAPEILKLLHRCHGSIVEDSGFSYLRADELVYSCETSPEGTALLERIASACANENETISEGKALRAALAGYADVSLLHKFGLEEKKQQCVVLFRLSSCPDEKLLRELIPLDKSDRLTVLENGDVVLLIQMDGRTADEVIEFASAAAETLEGEAGISCFAGVGRPADSLTNVSASFMDAQAALDTGMRHRIPGRVFVFSRQILERFADLIPAERAELLKRDIIKGGNERILTEEMLETIRVFFQNDLNLSTTARQLFIHRNTLIYRMDKIKKATGLDLRKFEDAVAFRMIMSIPEKQS